MSLSDKMMNGLNKINCLVLSEEDIKIFIQKLRDKFKVAYCLNPDVQFCGKCDVCINTDKIIDKEAGDKLI